MALPVLELSGEPYARGLAHGRQLRALVAANLHTYFERFEREGKLRRAEVLARATRYAAAIGEQSPAYFAEMRGVADGAGVGLDEVVALNVRYELLYYQFGVNALGAHAGADPEDTSPPARLDPRVDTWRGPVRDGCTAFAVSPAASADGHLWLGQNWDWIPQARGAILRTVEPDGLRTLSFNEAGIVGGKIGLNSAGLGLAINGLTTTDDDWSRLAAPFHLRCHAILRAHDIAAAERVVAATPRACSANFLIAQAPDRAVDIEAAPGSARRLELARGWLAHTNHFLEPDALGVVEPPDEPYPHSYHRLDRIGRLLGHAGGGGRPLTAGDLEGALRDHDDFPYSICRHPDPAQRPEERYATVVSAIMDLHARTLRISDGPPCRNPYQVLSLHDG
jgi:isopenicillin-N N-acyltransferase-like protein